MPQWGGSCWYYLRYLDPKNEKEFASKAAIEYWMPVDLYVGGAEHAVLHLLYARFWHKVLYDLGLVNTKEPFQKLVNQGLITSFAFQRKNKTLVPTDCVEEKNGAFIEKATGEELERVIAKMSKSLKNVVNPDDVIREFGADSVRMYEMFMGPIDAAKPWDPNGIDGSKKFLDRVWRLYTETDKISNGDLDIGKIYIAVGDWVGDDSSYPQWPVVVRTLGPKLFDPKSSGTIGYGEIEFTETLQASDGGMVEVEIPINYEDYGGFNRVPTSIIIVATASKYGDYYSGSTGSVMWLDDVELIYEESKLSK